MKIKPPVVTTLPQGNAGGVLAWSLLGLTTPAWFEKRAVRLSYFILLQLAAALFAVLAGGELRDGDGEADLDPGAAVAAILAGLLVVLAYVGALRERGAQPHNGNADELEHRVEQRTAALARANAALREEIGERIRVEQQLREREAHRRRVVDELETSRGQLRKLAAHMEAEREAERVRIAREVHDQLGSSLTLLRLDLRRAAGKPLAKEQSDALVELIDEALETVRRIATELRPNLLQQFGFAEALKWRVAQYEARLGIPCRIAIPNELPDLPLDRATAALRIVEEALTNVARHARAGEVDITVQSSGDSVSIEVRDDGVGVSEARLRTAHSLGLLGMRERAYHCGGEFEIASTPGQGTAVKLRLPSSDHACA